MNNTKSQQCGSLISSDPCDGDQHKYFSSVCCRPKKATPISTHPRTKTYKDTCP